MQEHTNDDTPWARDAGDLLNELAVDPDRGLDDDEAAQRRAEYGRNELREAERPSWWRVLGAQFQSIVVYLLGAAAVLAFATARWAEGIAVVAVIAINTAIGFVSEWKAVRSMAALRALGQQQARVRRDAREQSVPTSELVPGDIVLVGPGDLVPADLRVVDASRLRVSEAPLTGESVPVDKTAEPAPDDAPLAERSSMLFKGTSVADGEATCVVVGTGQATELGRISELAATAESGSAPLQERLDALGHRLAWLTVAVAGVVAVVGILVRDQETTLVIETSIALGVAAIPEGLPIVATIALARGMYRMAQRNALVNRLAAVETLGATRIIFTDKTGTLTENHMRLHSVATAQGVWRDEDDEAMSDAVRRTIELAALCNEATVDGDDGPSGDPTEIALLEATDRAEIDRTALRDGHPRERLDPFDPDENKMATWHRADGRILVAVKGAPEAVLEAATRVVSAEGTVALDDEARERWSRRSDELARDGLRVLGVAERHADNTDGSPWEDLTLVGLVGLLDPPRSDVRAAINRCQAAGIRVEMITGDQAGTATAIAEAVGIVGDDDDPATEVMHGRELRRLDASDASMMDRVLSANIFARVSPEQKLQLVEVYQNRGEIVAMTGDGVNDAPALKKADIGVAMGQRGTDAARQVADTVLRDDAFDTIVAAVEEGRVIFSNIRASAVFMLTTNVAEVIAVTVATITGWPLPLRPLQILYLNVLTDVLPALALGVGPGSGDEMQSPPRPPDEAVLAPRHWMDIAGLASVVAVSVLGALMLALHVLELPERAAVTVSFLTLGFGKLWFTFNLRRTTSSPFDNEVTRNPWVWGALAVCIALLFASVYLPGLNTVLGTESPGARGWGLLFGASLLPLVVGQGLLFVRARLGGAPGG